MSLAANSFQDLSLPTEHEPLSTITRRCLLVAIALLHVGGGWALLTMQTPQMMIGDITPIEVRIVQDEPASAPAEDQLQPPEELQPPVFEPPPVTEKPPPDPVIEPPKPETPPPQVELALEPPPPDLPPPEFPVAVKPPPPPPPPKPVAKPTPPRPEAKPAPPTSAPPVAAPPAAVSAAPQTVSATEVRSTVPVSASYPAQARRLGQSGTTMVRLLIDIDGRPTQVSVNRSSGFPLLDDEAVSAVRKARFKAYTVAGVAQPVWVLIPIKFTLQ